MARPKRLVEQPVYETSAAIPELRWLRCCDDGGIPFYEASREFPFRAVHEFGESFRHAEDYQAVMKRKILYEPFMGTICQSSFACIIQKSFTADHYTAIIYAIKHLRKEAGKIALKKMVIVTDPDSVSNFSKDLVRGLFDLDIKSSLFVGKRQTSSGKPYRTFHDRIVLLDGVFYHFGSDVCGMHSSPYAFSGPWEDVGGRLRSFIENMGR